MQSLLLKGSDLTLFFLYFPPHNGGGFERSNELIGRLEASRAQFRCNGRFQGFQFH